MLRSRHWMSLGLSALAAGCAASGGQEPPLPFPKETYGALLTEFKRIQAEGSHAGCGTVGFELDDAGHASGFRIFYSAPDIRFAQAEIQALSATQFPPNTQPRRRAISMTGGHDDGKSGMAECNRHDFKQAGHQATAEGYLE